MLIIYYLKMVRIFFLQMLQQSYFGVILHVFLENLIFDLNY